MNIDIYLHALTSLLVIVDPIGGTLVFNSLTSDYERKLVVRTAIKSVIVAMSVVVIFSLYGEAMLTRLGISIQSLRIAGGLLLFWTAFNMITREPKYKVSTETRVDIAVYPMAIPLLAGPGCMTVTILLFTQVTDAVQLFSLYAAVATVYVIVLPLLIFAKYFMKYLGATGDDVIRRMMGVILAALAVQFVADGVKLIARM